MSKSTIKRFVPKLRFPAFRGAGSWKKIKLIYVADKKIRWSFIGGPFGSNLKSSDYVTDGVRIIQLQNIGDAEFKNDYKIFTSEEKADELLSNNIYPGEIILSKMGDPVGRACLIPGTHPRYVMCSDGIRLVVDEELFSQYFIYTLINSDHFRNLVEKTATGSTRKGIGLADLKNLPMIVPKPKEQQKIADCLSSIDELITAHTQKHEALKAHKKGLMQQLFPAEGETIPKLRFPEFQDAGGWGKITLGKTVKFLDGKRKSIKESDRATMQGQFPYYGASGIIDYVNNFIFDEDLILLGEVGENIVSRNLPLVFKVSGKCWVNYHAHVLQPIKPHCLDFLVQYMENLSYLKYNSGGAQPKLNQAVCKAIPLILPLPKEQQKIADFLSTIDELITAQTQKIKSLKTHKKGLMQQLFPATDEVRA